MTTKEIFDEAQGVKLEGVSRSSGYFGVGCGGINGDGGILEVWSGFTWDTSSNINYGHSSDDN